MRDLKRFVVADENAAKSIVFPKWRRESDDTEKMMKNRQRKRFRQIPIKYYLFFVDFWVIVEKHD